MRPKTASLLKMNLAILIFYGALFGYLIHDETISARTAVGGLVVLTGLICETVRHVKQKTH